MNTRNRSFPDELVGQQPVRLCLLSSHPMCCYGYQKNGDGTHPNQFICATGHAPGVLQPVLWAFSFYDEVFS
jgi:hypothetical protein